MGYRACSLQQYSLLPARLPPSSSVWKPRWARDTDRSKAAAAAAAAEAALAAAGEDARRERKAWESLQAALEGAAAARETEAREAAEEAGRKVRGRDPRKSRGGGVWVRGIHAIHGRSRIAIEPRFPTMLKGGGERRVFTDQAGRGGGEAGRDRAPVK